MATNIKIITSGDFMEVTPAGIINIVTSKQLLVDIAKAQKPPADYELLVDFRNTRSDLTVFDLYELVGELYRHGDTFRRKAALLVLPGVNFELASFFETCSRNRGFSVNAFTDYEHAMRWLLSEEDTPENNTANGRADAGDGALETKKMSAPVN
ncbi:MAG: hypothetical protein JW832_12875 [Deltaproteobacteria bacterium]|nr:hypothetical protein [Deltaproteobacteria bacterium]